MNRYNHALIGIL